MAAKPVQKPLGPKGVNAPQTLYGTSAGEKIKGHGGDDVLIGLGGADVLAGGKGADTFRYLSFDDSRGARIDHIADFNATEGDTVDLRALGTATLQPAYNQFFDGLQAVFTFDASGNRSLLSYYQGSDTPVFQIEFKGNVGYSAAFLGIVLPTGPTEGDDNLLGTSGDDNVQLLGGNDRYDGLGGNDVINGGYGNDTLLGGAGNDSLFGFYGSDTMTGGTGADTFLVTWLNNPGDVDVITDFNRAEGDQIDAWSSRTGRFQTLGWVLVDGAFSQAAYDSTEAGQIVQVANGDGTYTLSFYFSRATEADGPGVQLVVNTKLVPDDFIGDKWVQYLAVPTDGPDSFVGYNGDDRISLLGGDDSYDGLSGNDQVDGGAGNDTIRTGNPIGTNIGGSVLIGGSGNDLLIAGSAQDRLDGGSGSDRLLGNGGDDMLIGGPGGDYLDGGSGADTFLYFALADSPRATGGAPAGFPFSIPESQPDTIFGFDPGAGDVIDLRQLDVDPNTAGLQAAAWTFSGSAYSAGAGAQITLAPQTITTFETGSATSQSGTILSLYLDDGDQVPDFQIQLTGSYTTTQGILW